MNTIRNLLIGGGTILAPGAFFDFPSPSPIQEFSLEHPQSIAHDMLRVAQDMKVVEMRHEHKMKQAELPFEHSGA